MRTYVVVPINDKPYEIVADTFMIDGLNLIFYEDFPKIKKVVGMNSAKQFYEKNERKSWLDIFKETVNEILGR